MKVPQISVLVPCYNARRYVSETLDSVLSQTYSAVEIIVVDDGSTDGTLAVLEQYRDRGITVVRQANRGAAAARNRAFAVSKGDAVLYLDADDLVNPQHLTLLVQRLAECPKCVAMGAWDRFYAEPHEAVFPSHATYRDMDGPQWLAMDWQAARPMTQSGMFLIPRTLIERFGGWNEQLSLIDDFEFFARIISRSSGVKFADGARLYYRSAVAGSLSGRKSRKAVESAFLSLMLGTGHLLAAEDSPRTRRACANVLQDFDYSYYPDHADLRARVRARVAELGGSDLAPDGPPGFHRVRRLVGWRMARRAQRVAERLGLNGASRRSRSASRS